MRADMSVVAGTRYTTDGFLETQTQPIGRGTGGSSTPGFTRHAYGFLGRANDPDVDNSDPTNPQITNGAHLLHYYEGNTLHTIHLDDPRVDTKLPQIGKGAAMQYGAGGSPDVTPSLSLHDGQGNILTQVDPTKKITITVGNGPPLVLEGQTVKVGDDPVAVALGAALKTVIDMVVTLMGTNAVNGSPPQTALQISAFKAAVADYQTNEFEAT